MTDKPRSDARFSGLDALYDNDLGPALAIIEANRRRCMKLWRNVTVLVVLITPGLVWACKFSPDWFISVVGYLEYIQAGVILVAISIVSSFFFILGELAERSRAHLMETICGSLGLHYSRKVTGKASLTPFNGLDFLAKYHRKTLEDEITGSHAGIDFVMVEANLEERRTVKGESRYYNVFSGILAIYTFPKRFQGTTKVMNSSEIFESSDRVKLEDSVFESKFDVFSTDQVEARYILTPGFMENVLALQQQLEKAGESLEIAFHEAHMLIALSLPRNRFEIGIGSMFSRLDNPERARRIANEIRVLFTIPEKLDILDRG